MDWRHRQRRLQSFFNQEIIEEGHWAYWDEAVGSDLKSSPRIENTCTGDSSRPPALILGFRRFAEISQIAGILSKSNPCCIVISIDGPGEPESLTTKSLRLTLQKRIGPTTNLVLEQQPRNLGIAKHLQHAVSKVLSRHESLIVLEDDCIPASGLYSYMAQALSEHQSNKAIGTIAADAHVMRKRDIAYIESSMFPLTWAWGTWADRWTGFDAQLSTYSLQEIDEAICRYNPSPLIRRHWKQRIRESIADANMWDAQWTVYQWLNNYSTLNPSFPLVNNVGNDSNATHTLTESIFTNSGFHRLSGHVWKSSEVSSPIRWGRLRTFEHFFLIRLDNLLGLFSGKPKGFLISRVAKILRILQDK